jgi:organic hydroperoxide reductase OsmC/OhrA
MAEHLATISWHRDGELFTDNKYSRAHTWRFDGGATVAASASPHIVRAPYSVASAVDPEEAFVASLSSCHMLFFLSIAANAGYVVDSYEDEARGTLAKDAGGRLVMTQVVLRPRIAFVGRQPSAGELDHLHHQAHDQCFLANSVKTLVTVEAR